MKKVLGMHVHPFREGDKERYGLELKFTDKFSFYLRYPAVLQIVTETGKLVVYKSGYEMVEKRGESFLCRTMIETDNGSSFLFSDQYEINNAVQEVKMSRNVTVVETGVRDIGFSTEFAVPLPRGEKGHWSEEYDVFIPGIWYKKNQGVVKGAFGSDLYRKNFLFRATRMALPYVQLYHAGCGLSVGLCHMLPVPDTKVAETGRDWIVDSSLQYPSIGFTAGKRLLLSYVYPGSEGEISYIGQTGGWARRNHPVRREIIHKYELCVHFDQMREDYEAMREEWRHWYDVFQPEVHECDLQQVYEDGIALLDAYCQPYNKVMGLPFWTTVPEGHVCDISFQMGFVGQQTQCAYHLIRYGEKKKKQEMVEKGKEMINFWVQHSDDQSEFPQVWYDVFPPQFKQGYPAYLRTAADGVEGILAAWMYLKEYGEDRHEWFDFCCRFADHLGNVQGEDGSFARAYGKQGEIQHSGKYNTSNVIRFLVNLYFVSGKEKYREMALRAGEFCYTAIYQSMAFIGGTADNDNTIDKEAGMQSLYAFLALYDLTKESKWINAARGAADFCETWTYAWRFPVHPYKGNCVFEKADQTGLSLIATGHSHCDVMMGYCPYDYFRLWILTGDRHYLEFARMILHNTKQTTDWKRTYGYSYPGLIEESGEIALQYHNGLGKWLPWCTIAEIEALTRLEEQFGQMDISEDKNISDKKLIDKNYSQFF